MQKTIFLSEAKQSSVENHIEVPYIFYEGGKWREDVRYIGSEAQKNMPFIKQQWKNEGYLIK